jgi:hypothetical protein
MLDLRSGLMPQRGNLLVRVFYIGDWLIVLSSILEQSKMTGNEKYVINNVVMDGCLQVQTKAIM